jgi:hypothetical protein
MVGIGLTTPPWESKVFARFFQKALLSSPYSAATIFMFP